MESLTLPLLPPQPLYPQVLCFSPLALSSLVHVYLLTLPLISLLLCDGTRSIGRSARSLRLGRYNLSLDFRYFSFSSFLLLKYFCLVRLVSQEKSFIHSITSL